MVNIEIDKRYQIPENWSEMPDTMASAIFQVPIPSKLKEFYDHKMLQNPKEEPVISKKDLMKTFPAYYGQVLEKMGISAEITPRILATDRIWFYQNYCLKFVLGLHYWPDYEPKKPEYIVHNGEKLYFPKSKEVFGNEIPMAYTTAFEWSEAMDLEMAADEFKGGKYEIGRTIASILLRPQGEAYDEDVSLERAKGMNLNMDTVWEVFFCLIELLSTQRTLENSYLAARVRQGRGIRHFWKRVQQLRGLRLQKT